MAKRADSILELVGDTPIVRLNKLPQAGDATVWAKLEYLNPLSSVKDRICLAMVEAAEASGQLKRGMKIVEATSGNTGIGLGMVAAVKGYGLILVMPDSMSIERRTLLRALGADLVLTPASAGMRGAMDRAGEIARDDGNCFVPDQFRNPANPEVHSRTTAQEILEQTEGRIDAFVAGVGTGGTVTGVGRVLKAKDAAIRVVAVEPAMSAVLSGGEPSPHRIQGIGAGFVPEVLDRSVIDEIIQVKGADAIAVSRRLAREEGILAGISAGANAFAALQVARDLGRGKHVVTVMCDTGERYLSTELFE